MLLAASTEERVQVLLKEVVCKSQRLSDAKEVRGRTMGKQCFSCFLHGSLKCYEILSLNPILGIVMIWIFLSAAKILRSCEM